MVFVCLVIVFWSVGCVIVVGVSGGVMGIIVRVIVVVCVMGIDVVSSLLCWCGCCC